MEAEKEDMLTNHMFIFQDIMSHLEHRDEQQEKELDNARKKIKTYKSSLQKS